MSARVLYYLTRAILSAALAGIIFVGGGTWWMAALAGGLSLLFFLWAPHSGRYVVHSEGAAAPLRRDERGLAIANQAARNAFVVVMLSLTGLVLYGVVAASDLPAYALTIVLALGVLTFLASDLWLRRT